MTSVGREHHKAAPGICVVAAVTPVTPRMVRLSLRGPGLVGLTDQGPDQRVKVGFPEGRRFGGDPGEVSRARRRRRTYTLLHLDPATGSADIDFVLHGHGLAAEWAREAQIGDEVALTAPIGRAHLHENDGSAHLLICDETGLPALRAILAALPPGRAARAFIEIHDEAERQPLPSPADVDITWLTRGGQRPDAPLSALTEADLTVDPATQVWIAGESDTVRLLRTLLLTQVGVERSHMTAVAYWQRGTAEAGIQGRPGLRGC